MGILTAVSTVGIEKGRGVPVVSETVSEQDGAADRGCRRAWAKELGSRPWTWLAVVLVPALLGFYNGLVYHSHLDQPHRFAILALVFYIGLAATVLWCGPLLGLLGFRWLWLTEVTWAFGAGKRLALAALWVSRRRGQGQSESQIQPI